MNRFDNVYYVRMLRDQTVADILSCKVRTVEDGWFAAMDKTTKQVFLFSNNDVGKTVFFNRSDAVEAADDLESLTSD